MNSRCIVASICVLLMALPVGAQISTGFPQFFRQLLENETGKRTLDGEKESDVRELVETLLLIRLSEALNLTDEETVVVVRRLDKWKEKLQSLKYNRARLARELRSDLESGVATDLIAKKLANLESLDLSIAQSTQTLVEVAGKDLTIQQTAKFYLFLGDFDRELRRMIDRAKRHAERRENGRPARRVHREYGPAAPKAPLTPRAPKQP